jgi:hypothetical protein
MRAHPGRLAGALLGLGLLLVSPPDVARAQDPSRANPSSANPSSASLAECSQDFSARVAEAIWLRDEEPQTRTEESPLAEPANGAELDARTRFSLAVVIGDLLLLREQSGTASWPATLSQLSSQELRRRRDAPAFDATACEIVRFMRDRYSAERARDAAVLAKRAAPPQRPTSAPAPAPRPEPREAPVRVAASTVAKPPVVTSPSPAPPAPAPTAAQAKATPAEPATPAAPSPPRMPEAATAPEVRRGIPREPRRIKPVRVPDEEMPAAPPPVAPPDVTPLPERREDPPALAATDPPALAPVDPPAFAPSVPRPVEPQPAVPESPTREDGRSAAKTDLAALETELAAPSYLTLRAMRRDGANRPDDEVWRLRRRTLEAREELVRLLRKLSSDPERLAGVKSLLGAQGCTRLEKRMRELYMGGPGSELGDIALSLWKRQPNPS